MWSYFLFLIEHSSRIPLQIASNFNYDIIITCRILCSISVLFRGGTYFGTEYSSFADLVVTLFNSLLSHINTCTATLNTYLLREYFRTRSLERRTLSAWTFFVTDPVHDPTNGFANNFAADFAKSYHLSLAIDDVCSSTIGYYVEIFSYWGLVCTFTISFSRIETKCISTIVPRSLWCDSWIAEGLYKGKCKWK